jgi:hypothetical protein
LLEPFPDFTLIHLLEAAKRHIAYLSELKLLHESELFDLALCTFSQLRFVIERAIIVVDADL